eukprot:gene1372-1391_t
MAPQGGVLAAETWVAGYTRAIFDLNLSLPVAGRVDALRVAEGDFVAQGGILLNLDNHLETIEMERRKAMFESHAELNAALARQPILSMQLRAARTMFAANAGISREDVQAKELAVLSGSGEIEMRRATLEVQRHDYETALAILERRSLRAPVAGRVVRIHRYPGESIQANETILRFVSLDRILFIAAIEEAAARKLTPGGPALLMLEGNNGEEAVQGKISLIAPVTDPASGLVEVRVEIPNSDERFRAGSRARLRLATD